jgi:hypothetical protein
MVMKQGIYPGLGMAEYHDWKLDKSKLIAGPISCSMLKAFAVNPYAWRWGPEFKQTAAMAMGSLFDAAVTDPQALADNYVVSEFSDFRTKAAREWKAEMEESGLSIVSEDDLNHAIEGAKRCREHKVAGSLIEGAQFQVGVIGEVGDIPAKCLIDILPEEESLVDYKTIATGLDDESIRKAIGKYKYHWQGAFYRTLFNKVSTDKIAEDFKLIFQDVTTLEIRVVTLSEDAMALGTQSVKVALKEFARCAHKGIRSRYEETDESIDLMPYHAMSEDEWNIQQEEQ